MLFFYFDGAYDGYTDAGLVRSDRPRTRPGAQTVFVPDGIRCAPRPAEDGVTVYPKALFDGIPILTVPNCDHQVVATAFLPPGQDEATVFDLPLADLDFEEALEQRHPEPLHQVGGYAATQQGPAEADVAMAVMRELESFDWHQAAREQRAWQLLLQVDSDPGLDMMWGDSGRLYWLARAEGLARHDLPELRFTWQSC